MRARYEDVPCDSPSVAERPTRSVYLSGADGASNAIVSPFSSDTSTERCVAADPSFLSVHSARRSTPAQRLSARRGRCDRKGYDAAGRATARKQSAQWGRRRCCCCRAATGVPTMRTNRHAVDALVTLACEGFINVLPAAAAAAVEAGDTASSCRRRRPAWRDVVDALRQLRRRSEIGRTVL